MTTAATPSRGTALRQALPGLLLAALLGAAALWISDLPFVKNTLHWSALLIVILLGMVWASVKRAPTTTAPGIRIAQRPVLRWAVAGLGFRLSLPELWHIGLPALVVVTVSTGLALLFGWWVARRLRVGEQLGLLLGVGGAICGASAVVAADSVVQSEKQDAPLALGIITLLGTVGIVVYPGLQRSLGMSDFLFGVWDGASLHEMAQVVAAGFNVSDEAARVATVVKLARICLLAPVVLLLGWTLRRRHRSTGHAQVSPVPWFLVLFVVFAVVNSLGAIPPPWLQRIQRGDLWLLCVGMAGVGLQTRFGDMARAGLRPILAGTLQWIFLATVAYLLAVWLCR
jgi:uncharacterized integral membrane protein (TIGR00698 family)